jgi:hypothetical protein
VGCLFVILGLFFPRLTIILIEIFSYWFDTTNIGVLWIILGFIFMPFTLLWVSVVMNYYNGEWGFGTILLLILAILLDLGSDGNSVNECKEN